MCSSFKKFTRVEINSYKNTAITYFFQKFSVRQKVLIKPFNLIYYLICLNNFFFCIPKILQKFVGKKLLT